ncbi:hypothetical protein V6N11_078970 [Hibiscus sabdariffa]|uniref:S-protein homolog n=1 Tax=Hibiscus sabdariffa TaxID=183260 RepID=A0ABR2RUQ3_9ROSI
MLVLGSKPLWFKIVRISDSMHDSWPGCSEEGYEDGFYDGCYRRYHCEISDSKSWEWSQSDDLVLSTYNIFVHDPSVSACGGLH